jgi:hypothetical protein
MKNLNLYQKRLVRTEHMPLLQKFETSPAFLLFQWVYDLSCTFDTKPSIYGMDGGRMLAIVFPDASFNCEDYFADYGDVMACLSQHWPVTVYGTAPGPETAELQAKLVQDDIVCSWSCVSGRNFERCLDLYIKLETSDNSEWAFLKDALEGIGNSKSFVAVSRCYECLLQKAGILSADGAKYCYIPLSGESDTAEQLHCLAMEQKAELWRTFLSDGVSSMEFEWLWDAYLDGSIRSLLEWELALEGVLCELQFTVSHDPHSFHVIDAAGSPIRLDYIHGTAAEKMFLKILFPVNLENL